MLRRKISEGGMSGLAILAVFVRPILCDMLGCSEVDGCVEEQELQLDVVDGVGLLTNTRFLLFYANTSPLAPFFLATSTNDLNNGTGQLNAPLECVWVCNDYWQNLMHCSTCAVRCMPSMALWVGPLLGPVRGVGSGGILDLLDSISA